MESDNLSKNIGIFLQSQTNNQQVIDLGMALQNQIALGHTAIKHNEIIDDPLISEDGKSGYIVQDNGLAGFRRVFNQEQYIRDHFKQPSTNNINKKLVKAAIQSVLKILGLDLPESLDLQWQACLSCLHHNRYILTGGPGTGKTTTVIRMMLLFLLMDKSKKIALSAPTGKAANQMIHSIGQQLHHVQLPIELQQVLEIKAQTIHRLLGYNNQTNSLKYNKNNPLPYDLIIIDESSMLDVSLTHALLQALKPTTQLLLIGDKNQLPAVEAGNVFADLCQLLINNQNNEKPIDLLSYFLNENNEKAEFGQYTELTKNYRYTDGSLIAQLCSATKNTETPIFHQLRKKKLLNWLNPKTKSEKKDLLSSWYQSIPNHESAILLSPVNNGSNSVSELNDLARKILYNNKYMHHNMPIMVTQNDYALGLFNGDIGQLCLIDNQWQVVFNIESEQKFIQLNALQGWQQANAITIHKSQGSEYDHVLIAIPNDFELNILTNALLYTAISRAKQTISLWASDEIIEKTIQTKENRLTFLNNSQVPI